MSHDGIEHAVDRAPRTDTVELEPLDTKLSAVGIHGRGG
jgi:hypothetical protein